MRGIEEAIKRLSDYGLTFNLEDFLRSHLAAWEESFGVGMEVLYFNKEQMLLEQIASVGFSTARNAVQRRVKPDLFERQGICSYAVVQQKSVLIPNVKFDIRYIPVQEPDNTRSELVIPLHLSERVIGVLNLEAEDERAFSNDNLEYFEQISPLLAIMLEYQSYREEEHFFADALSSISALPDQKSIYPNLLASIIKFLSEGFVGCILIIPENRRSKLLHVVAKQGVDLKSDQEIRSSKIAAVRKALDDPSEQYVGPVGEGPSSMDWLAPGIRSEYALVMRVPTKIKGVLYLGSARTVFSERSARSIRRLCEHISALLEGLEKRAERERRTATDEVLTLVDNELHNQAGLLSIVLSRISQRVKVPTELMKSGSDIVESLRGTYSVVKGFQVGQEKVGLSYVLRTAEHYAKELGIGLHQRGNFGADVICNKVGLGWIVENLLLNSARHAKAGVPVEVWLENELDGKEGALSYWDNGRLEGEHFDILKRLGEGVEGRHGVKIIRRLCDQFKWILDVSLTPERGPLYKFKYFLDA